MSSLNYRAGWGYGTSGFSQTADGTGTEQFSGNGPRFAPMAQSSSTGTVDLEVAQKGAIEGSTVSRHYTLRLSGPSQRDRCSSSDLDVTDHPPCYD